MLERFSYAPCVWRGPANETLGIERANERCETVPTRPVIRQERLLQIALGRHGT